MPLSSHGLQTASHLGYSNQGIEMQMQQKTRTTITSSLDSLSGALDRLEDAINAAFTAFAPALEASPPAASNGCPLPVAPTPLTCRIYEAIDRVQVQTSRIREMTDLAAI